MKETVFSSVRWVTQQIEHLFWSLIAPPFCTYCFIFLQEEKVLCNGCFERIQPIVSVKLPVTKTVSIPVHALGAYQEPLKTLLLAKLQGNIVPLRQLALLMAELPVVQQAAFDYIVPIPLHWTRLALRGFNQADEIAEIISEKTGKPVVHLLKRVRRTQFQSALRLPERKDNLKDAFILKIKNGDQYKNKRFLIVDDLFTTGTTLASAAKLLLAYKPESITALVGCRVI